MSQTHGLTDPPKQIPDPSTSPDRRDYETKRDDYQYELTTKVYEPEPEVQLDEH